MAATNGPVTALPIRKCPWCRDSRRITHSQDDEGRVCPYCFDWPEVAQTRKDAAALVMARAMPTAATRQTPPLRIGLPVIMPQNGAPGWDELRSSLVAESDKPVALMAEIAEKWQTKRLINARDQADQMLAELGIELGQRDGETLLAAARRVRETGTHAEVERLNKLCEFYLANLTERANQLTILAMALGEHDGMTDEEAARALVKERDELAANLDTQRTEVRKLQAILELCRNERDRVAKDLLADKEACARDATRVRLALESEVKDLKDRLGAATAELAIIAKGYDEALELCDRDGMTPTEQIKELQSALAEEKKQRQDFVAALCAELGVQ